MLVDKNPRDVISLGDALKALGEGLKETGRALERLHGAEGGLGHDDEGRIEEDKEEEERDGSDGSGEEKDEGDGGSKE